MRYYVQDLFGLRRNQIRSVSGETDRNYVRDFQLFRAGSSWPDLNQIRFCTSGPVPISVALSRQDPFGLNELRLIWSVSKDRSGLYPAFLFRAGCSWPDLNWVDLHFGASGPVSISMSYPGFDELNRRSQIRLIILRQNRVVVTGIRHFQPGPDCHRRPVKTRWLILLRQNRRSGSLTSGAMISIQGPIVIAGLSRLADYNKIYPTRVFYFSVTHSDPLSNSKHWLKVPESDARSVTHCKLCFHLYLRHVLKWDACADLSRCALTFMADESG